MAPRRKTLTGHKRARIRRGFEVVCECGWESCIYYGKGALSEAHGEWHSHLYKCERAALAEREAGKCQGY